MASEPRSGQDKPSKQQSVVNVPASTSADDLFAGGGELGALMRAKDWSQTPLGPVESWPQNLKTCVRIVLTSRQAMFVWWGDDLIYLYNDAYRSILGNKHPHALGQPGRVVWSEIWDQVAPRVVTAMRENTGTYDESLLLIMQRYGYEEETYYTFSYSPVPNDQGGNGGILCANTENTQQIISERQMSLLRDLAARTVDARTWQEACTLSAESLASDPRDLSFALIYVADSAKTSVRLAASTGIDSQSAAAPATVALEVSDVWPLAQAMETHEVQLVADLESRLPAIPANVWNRTVHSAAVVPILPSGPNGRPGALVVGLNPFRRFDDTYHGFLKLVAGQISASIANAAAYEEERRRAEALAELDRAKTTFFSNVSHEFRTPLTLMLGPLEDLLSGAVADSNRQHRKELEVVHRNGLRLLKLVNALLDFSRIEAGRIDARYEPVDLCSVTCDLASVFSSAMKRAGLRYTIDCQPLAGPVYLDREMWEKVVLNLISNALKFTLDGEVVISLRSQGMFAELVVRDTGLGIPDTELPRIFERFHRVEETRGRTHEGTGIGLALVDELVRLHGGTVQAESTLGKGTTFTVRMPYGSVHLAPEKIVPEGKARSQAVETSPYVQEALRWLPDSSDVADSSGLGDSAEPELTGGVGAEAFDSSAPSGRVLLVDDNRDMREYVERLLARRFEVTVARNGVEALKLAKEDPPDVVLTDVMMPEMDGFELLSELRKAPETMLLPVIMLSARAGEESRAQGMEAGADDYLVKPFTARELMARVGAHLSMKQLREQFSSRERAERQRAEAAETQYRRILESISEGFIFVDAQWSIRYVNQVYGSFTRRSPNDLIGQNFWEQFPEVTSTKFAGAYLQAMGERRELEIEEYYPPLDAWLHVHIYPDPNGLSMFVSDVTAQRRQREALLVSEKLAATGRLASTVAHEINNPLESVINLLYLARSTNGAEDKDKYLEWAEREINRVAHIARQTLGFYRESTQPTQVQVATIVENLLQVYRGKLNTRQIHVRSEIPAGLRITARSGELNQVLSNLITNAIDACSPGGRLVISAISAAEGGREGVEITVSDDGFGISPDDMPRIFEPFFTTKKDIGTGLGLWVVKQIVEGNQGKVSVQSTTEPGECGTSVTIFMPNLEPAAAEITSGSAASVKK